MSYSNNMMLRAKVNEDGSIAGFELGNYSGGSVFDLRLVRVVSDDFYRVVEGNGYRGTLLMKRARVSHHHWTSHDLDELGLEILTLWRENGLEERDARAPFLNRFTNPGRRLALGAERRPDVVV